MKSLLHRDFLLSLARPAALVLLVIVTVLAWTMLFRSHSVAPEATHTSPPPSAAASPATESASETDTETDAAAEDDRPTAVFVGSSYAAGSGATFNESRWTSLVAEAQGWNEINLAQAGTGYLASTVVDGAERLAYAELADSIIEAAPDVVVISGGRNDVGESPFNVQQTATSLFGQLSQALPNAQIYVINPWWDATEQPIGLQEVTGAVEAAAAQTGVTYIETGQPLEDPALLADDIVSPNDQGHAALAEAVNAAIEG